MQRAILKGMMVGLPGRFLRQPEQYHLVHVNEANEGETPLLMRWRESSDRKFSDWVIRAEYDKESTALSYIGGNIVAEMRQELYRKMLEEVKHGNVIVRSYVDCYAITSSSSGHVVDFDRDIGTDLGQWKEERYTNGWTEENRFVGEGEGGKIEIKAPGFGGKRGQTRRIELLQKYRKLVANQVKSP